MTSSSSSLVDASNGDGKKKLYIKPKRLHDELTRGREMTDQLRVMLCEITGGEGSSPPVVTAAELLAAQGLVGKIVDTFTQSIVMLDEESPHAAPVIDSSPARNSEDSGESGKTPVHKDRRGCYKRRRSQKTYTKDTPGSFDDGHAWRKYGQKKILDSKHPRNYYRCTHKYDQSCQAKKHVQQIQENPPLYRTTYDGQHTCKNLAAATRSSPHQLFTTTSSITHDQSSSLLWNFQLQPNNYNFTVSIRDKSEINKTPSPSDYTKYSVVNGGYYMSPDHLKVFDQADHNQQHLSDRGDVISNVSEVYSCTESTHDSMHQQMHDMLSGVDSAFDDFLMD